MIDAISNAIDAIDNAADFIKTFGHYPLTTESLRQAVEGLQSLQNRGEADHDALNDLWACAESGYSLDDLKAKIKMYLDASTQPVVPEVRVLSRDEARLALWRAIQEVVVGNPTDDKLILENLYKSGVWLCLLSAGKETA